MKGYKLEPKLLRKIFFQEYGFEHMASFKKEFREELTQIFGKDPRQWIDTDYEAFESFMRKTEEETAHTSQHNVPRSDEVCHRCNGTGKLFGHQCQTCYGSGRINNNVESKFEFNQVVEQLTEGLTDQPVFVHDNTSAFNNWKRIKDAILLNNETVEIVLEDGEKIPLPLKGPIHNYRLMLNDGQFTDPHTIAQIYGLLERPKVLGEDGKELEEGRYLGPIRPGSDRDLEHRDVEGSEPGAKDYMRIRDLRTRANGFEFKMYQLARMMASKITPGSPKAHRRAIAAQDVYPGQLGRKLAAIFLRGY